MEHFEIRVSYFFRVFCSGFEIVVREIISNMKTNKRSYILFTGGGTAGSVTPLLAVAEALQQQAGPSEKKSYRKNIQKDFVWVGTRMGVERVLVEQVGMRFYAIASGKLRRYFDVRNFIDPLFVVIGFFQAFLFLLFRRPAWVVGAGGFVQVPVMCAAWLLRIPVLVHQLDLEVGLANKLCVPFARKVTVSFPELIKQFPKDKVQHVGTPVRGEIVRKRSREEALQVLGFEFDPTKPVLLVMGGGAGSVMLNELVWKSLDELLKFTQVIQITGKGKKRDSIALLQNDRGYVQVELLVKEMSDAYWLSDAVVTRAGLGTMSELSALGKPTLVIPLETGNTQQVGNAEYFAGKGAVEVLREGEVFGAGVVTREGIDRFVSEVRELVENKTRQKDLSTAVAKMYVADAGVQLADILEK